MKTLLETDAHLLRASEKTNVALTFTVPEAVSLLRITYFYAPKTLDGEAARPAIEACLRRDAGEFYPEYPDWTHYLPLKNLVTLSLDAPDGFRGCAHRQADRQVHILSRAEASPGFLPGELAAGEWKLVLNVHALVTEFCDYHIKIEAEVDGCGD